MRTRFNQMLTRCGRGVRVPVNGIDDLRCLQAGGGPHADRVAGVQSGRARRLLRLHSGQARGRSINSAATLLPTTTTDGPMATISARLSPPGRRRSGLIDGSGFARAAESPRTLPAHTEWHRLDLTVRGGAGRASATC